MRHIDKLIENHPILKACRNDIEQAVQVIINSYAAGGKMLIAGNGGSAACSDHMTGELLKSFEKKRALTQEFINSMIGIDNEAGNYLKDKIQGSLPAIALTNNTAILTASLNDINADVVFAQQVNGYGCKDDVFFGLSTSGNSRNIIYAAVIARAKGMSSIALSGKDGGKLKEFADISIIVPETRTYLIQELHISIYHAICLEIEEYFWKE